MRHNCHYCQKAYEPRQVYCSAKCRIYANRNGSVTKHPKTVTQALQEDNVTVALQEKSFQEKHTRGAHKTLNEELACKVCAPL